jgi:uncharacterized protein YdeI (YjbR/CyaY-like superfamily)
VKRAKAPESPILALDNAEEWEAWLRKHHSTSRGVMLRLAKGKAKGTLTYASALDAALSWGWIDSQKRALDEHSWLQRFGPRTVKSPWSKINCTKAEALLRAGRLQPPGLAAVESAKADGRWQRAYASSRNIELPSDLARALKANPRARAFFDTLDAANRYAILYRVTTAKLDATRAARIEKFVTMCADGQKIHPKRP